MQESDGQEESKRLLFCNDENGKPVALQQTLKKSKSSFDNDGYQRVKVVDLEGANDRTDSEEDDGDDDAEESDVLTDEKQQAMTNSSPKLNILEKLNHGHNNQTRKDNS